MIDTISFRTNLILKDPLPSEWVTTKGSRKEQEEGKRFRKVRHAPTGIRLIRDMFLPGDAPWPWLVEASLARVLYGSNKRLVKTQHGLNKAFDQLHKSVNEATRLYIGPKDFTRVDLCWQHKGRARDYIAAHIGLSHPLLNGKHIIYWNETIIWESKGKKREQKDFRLQIYDKYKQLFGKNPGRVVRFELQIRKAETLAKTGFMLRNSYRPISIAEAYAFLRSYFCALSKARFNPWDAQTAAKKLGEYGIVWEKIFPVKPPKKFELLQGCEVPQRRAYFTQLLR